MSVELPVTLSIDDAQRAAIDDVNRWRGHCIELFARVEQDLASAIVGRISGRIPASVIAKIDALKSAGVPAKLVQTLDVLRQLTGHRNLIVHARSTVWINDRHSWLWAYCFQPSGKDKVEELGRWTVRQAEKFERDLARAAQSLSSQIERLPPA